MIKSVSLKNFKCFASRTDIGLARITLLYGHNGRGKSSLSQALLLLAQSMKERNELDTLSIVGDLVKLDSFKDILTAKSHETEGDSDNEISFRLETENENVEVDYTPIKGKPQLGQLSKLIFNGEDRFDVQATTGQEEQSDSEEKVAFSTSDIMVLQSLKNITYISAGRFGPVTDELRNDSLPSNRIGTKGESMLNALSRQSDDFIKHVGKCLSEILGGASINIPDKEATRIKLELNSKDDERTFHPINVGFGYSYVLPVIVGALLAEKGSILIIENPEAHLHPAAQSRILEFLIRESISKDLQIIVETHSDHVVNGLRISMKKKLLTPADGIIQHFAYVPGKDSPKVTPITSDREGNLSEYPDDFMDEWTAQMLQLV